MKKRVLSIFLCFMMCLSFVPAFAFAEGGHIHDSECGYAESVAGAPCTHECGEDCSPCTHQHDEVCGYVAAVEGAPCTYVEPEENKPVEEQPAESKPEEGQPKDEAPKADEAVAEVQAKVDDLPAVEAVSSMSAEQKSALSKKLDALCDAYYDGLTEEQQAQVTGFDKVEKLYKALGAYGVDITDTPAKDPVSYVYYENGVKKNGSCADYEIISAGTTQFEDGKWYVFPGHAKKGENGSSYPGGTVTVNGTSNLILIDGKELDLGYYGLVVPESSTLNIYGQSGNTGKLTVHGANGAAGIGGSSGSSCGTVNIHGGDITAEGNYYGAGIGGGRYGNGGNITIYGGSVTAKGAYNSAGIGGGSEGGNGANVTINGGTVTAIGGNGGGVGIGGDKGKNQGTLTLGAGVTFGAGESADNITEWTNLANARTMNYFQSPFTAPVHIHSFSFSASQNKVIATCANTDGACQLDEDGKHTVTLTLTANNSTYTGSAYNGASVSGADNFTSTTGASVGAIQYLKDGSPLTAAPTDAGSYTAKVIVTKNSDSAAAQADFTIAKVNYTDTVKTASGTLPATSGQTVEITLPAVPAGADYGAVTNENTAFFTVSAIESSKVTVTSAKDWNSLTETEAKTFTVAVTPDANHNGYDITVTVTPAFHDYTIIEGANSTWTKGGKSGLAIKSDAPFSKFSGVRVDGKVIADSNYTAVEGSTKVTFNPAYLDTLSAGKHTADIVSNDGAATTQFTIRNKVYTVSFDMRGHGDQIESQTVQPGGKASKPDNPKAYGYTFIDWYADEDCTVKFSFNTAINADTVVYAKWTYSSNSPKTGDSSNIILWSVLMLASCGAVAGVVIYSKKKKK